MVQIWYENSIKHLKTYTLCYENGNFCKKWTNMLHKWYKSLKTYVICYENDKYTQLTIMIRKWY